MNDISRAKRELEIVKRELLAKFPDGPYPTTEPNIEWVYENAPNCVPLFIRAASLMQGIEFLEYTREKAGRGGRA